MTGSIGGCASALHRFFAEICRVTTKRALVNRAISIAIERHTHVFEFVDRVRRLATHELNGVLITQPVRALDGVIHVPVPVVFAHVAKRSTDAALCCNRVRARGKHFRQDRDRKPGVCKLQRTTHTGTAGTHDDHIKLTAR